MEYYLAIKVDEVLIHAEHTCYYMDEPWKYYAAAAKSLQSCPTLCDPIEGSPPGSPVPGILQARTLEWVAISFSSAGKWKVKVKSLSRVRLLVTPWTAVYQAPPSMGFSRQEYWSGVPLPSPIMLSERQRNRKLISSCYGMGKEEGKCGMTANRYIFVSCCSDKKKFFSKIYYGNGCLTLWIYTKNQWIEHFKWINVMVYKLGLSKTFKNTI